METETTIDRINQQNRDLEDQLQDQARIKKELAKANRKKRRLNRKIAKGKATKAVRDSGWTGAVILLNEKGQPIGTARRDACSSPRVNMNQSPAVKRSWKLPDCEVEEVTMAGGIRAYDVYLKRGGHKRVQRIYPQNSDEAEAVVSSLERGNSPAAGAWSDGLGGNITWETAEPIGGPTASNNGKAKGCKGGSCKSCKGNACLKKKTDKSKSQTAPKDKSPAKGNACLKKTDKPKSQTQKQTQKKADQNLRSLKPKKKTHQAPKSTPKKSGGSRASAGRRRRRWDTTEGGAEHGQPPAKDRLGAL